MGAGACPTPPPSPCGGAGAGVAVLPPVPSAGGVVGATGVAVLFVSVWVVVVRLRLGGLERAGAAHAEIGGLALGLRIATARAHDQDDKKQKDDPSSAGGHEPAAAVDLLGFRGRPGPRGGPPPERCGSDGCLPPSRTRVG